MLEYIRGEKSMRDVYIYIIIMSMFFNTIAYIVLADDESIPTSPTNLVLSITSDRNEAKIGQPINISFNVTNIGTGKARKACETGGASFSGDGKR